MANPYFNATYYLANNPDVFAAGINTAEGAWAHYEQYGAAEALNGVASRSPAPWFDIAYYLAENPDLNTAGLTAGQLFGHFTEYGLAEGRSPSLAAEAVDAESLAAYAAANEDLRTAFGIEEGEEPTQAQLIQLAQHFYQFGYKENRDGLPAEFSDDTPGQTFTLTTNVDDFTGTNGDDTFQAILNGTDAGSTLNTFDKVDGAGGVDTLHIVGTNTGGGALPSNFTVSNVEVVNIEVDNAVNNLNSSAFNGVKELWQTTVAGAVTVGAGVTAGFRDVTPGTVTAAAGVESVSVAIDNITAGQTVSVAETTAGDVAVISVAGNVATNGAVTVDTAAVTTEVEVLNLAITSNSTVTVGANLLDLEVIDASGSTGNLTIDLAADGAGEALVSFIGGAGNDTVTISNADLDEEEVSIALGGGNDTLTFDLDNGGVATAVTISGDAGDDIFVFEATGGVGNLSAVTDEADLLENLVTIVDFDAGADAIDVSSVVGGVRIAQNVVNAAVNAAAPEDLFEAATAAFGTAGGATADLVVFAFGGNSYIGVDTDSSGGLSNDDVLIELAGIAVADLTAANFVF